MTETLISFILATATLAFSPGPDNIFVLVQSIVNGKKYGLATVLGLMTGCIIHTTLVAFGVSAILKQNENLFLIIKLFGAGYLLYLAYQVYKSDASITFSTDNVSQKTTFQLFKTGFWMNVLNPKVTIFFLAFFPQFLFSETISTVVQFYILGGLFIITSFIIFSSIALLAGSISETIKQNKKIGIYLKWMQIVVFIAIACLILLP
ncbi:lysine transporter LysE [Tenacibaculum todarodis]|uniref:Lysine transporter LysE n=1 Tax=Tenacibaculum todarodis TaxID=1850252 RepID=A0A1L3JGZ2_9FLAO|nr:LysE family translocator [Tenacibaculum todarodis]APG64401.1 lysine transporter LysE [Tenacibaculum todarodis]